MSIKKYCEVNRVSPSTFGYWRNRFTREGDRCGFVRVEVPVSGELIGIKIDERDVQLSVSVGTDPEYVATLIRLLREQ